MGAHATPPEKRKGGNRTGRLKTVRGTRGWRGPKEGERERVVGGEGGNSVTRGRQRPPCHPGGGGCAVSRGLSRHAGLSSSPAQARTRRQDVRQSTRDGAEAARRLSARFCALPKRRCPPRAFRAEHGHPRAPSSARGAGGARLQADSAGLPGRLTAERRNIEKTSQRERERWTGDSWVVGDRQTENR